MVGRRRGGQRDGRAGLTLDRIPTSAPAFRPLNDAFQTTYYVVLAPSKALTNPPTYPPTNSSLSTCLSLLPHPTCADFILGFAGVFDAVAGLFAGSVVMLLLSVLCT